MMRFSDNSVGGEDPKFESTSVMRSEYPSHVGARPAVPVKIPATVHVGRLPFEGSSVYSDSFVKKKPDPSKATLSNYKLYNTASGESGHVRFEGVSQSHSDFVPKKQVPPKPFTPAMTVHVGRLPFEGRPVYRESYVPVKGEKSKPTLSSHKLYNSVLGTKKMKNIKFEGESVAKSDFREKPLDPAKAFIPPATVHVGRLKFDGSSTYSGSFIPKEFDRSYASRTKEADFGGMHVQK